MRIFRGLQFRAALNSLFVSSIPLWNRFASMGKESLPQLSDSNCGTGPGSVPVFNCVVILTLVPGGTKIRGRVANLQGIQGEGNTERDVLLLLTKRFKTTMLEYNRSQQLIPWIDPPESPADGEQQRFIPVHL